MTTTAKIYSLVIPASGSFPLLTSGDYFKGLSATGAFETTGDTFRTLGAILAGQGLEGVAFSRLTFRDTSGASNTLRVLIAGDKFIDDRITGEVSMIDGGKARTISNAAFAWANGCGPIAAKFSAAQLYNPIG